MNDIIDHLNAQADEDEQRARSALLRFPARWGGDVPTPDEVWVAEYHEVVQRTPEPAYVDGVWKHTPVADCGMANTEPAVHIARHDPARVLREVEVLRQVINDYRAADGACMRSDDPDGPEYATIRAGRDAFKSVLKAYAKATGWQPSA